MLLTKFYLNARETSVQSFTMMRSSAGSFSYKVSSVSLLLHFVLQKLFTNYVSFCKNIPSWRAWDARNIFINLACYKKCFSLSTCLYTLLYSNFARTLPLASQFPVPKHSVGSKGVKYKPFVRVNSVN